jgi:hypothetical protein
MVLYPETQRKAQEEIDAVLGTERLPDFGDEVSLPYVTALCTEVQRWHPVAPLGELVASPLVWGLTAINFQAFLTGLLSTMSMRDFSYPPDPQLLATRGASTVLQPPSTLPQFLQGDAP